MTPVELAIWSAAAGAIGLVILVGVADLVRLRTVATVHGTVYNTCCLLFVVLLSGLPQALVPGWQDAPWLLAAQVLIGPVCVAVGDHTVRGWLAAEHRDRLMNVALFTGAIVALPAGALFLLLPRPQQLPAAAILVLLNTGMVVWLCVRAWLLGDALALGIAVGAVLMLPATGGLLAMAMGIPGLNAGVQALLAVSTVGCIAVIGFMLWRRNQHERRTRGFEPVESQFDPVTKLPGGPQIVRQLIRAQQRRRRTQREGAVIAVTVFATESIAGQVGTAGLNEMYMQLARRMQRQVGVVNPVGRYWDRCFVALVETIHSPAALRTLGLRVATTLRRPMQVTAMDGQSVQLRVEIGVGVVHLGRDAVEVEDVLHEAQQLAEAARNMPSRAAIRDAATRMPMPVEKAELGGRRRTRRAGSPRNPALVAARGRAGV